MIKEDNLGDTKFIWHSTKQAVSVPKGPENYKMGQKTGSFNGMKNKVQGSKYRAQSCLSIWGLADWFYCVSGQA